MPAAESIIVVAMTARGVIGRGGRIPWNLPEDLREFRRLTWGHTVIMGRATYESLGQPLPGRRNLVVSSTLKTAPGCEICSSFAAAMTLAGAGEGKVFVIGGAGLYRQALPLADALVISWVDGEYAGDAFFPPFDRACWRTVDCRQYEGFRIETCRRRPRSGNCHEH